MGRRAPPPLVLLPAEEAARALQGPALRGSPLRERFFPMQSSSHTPRPQRRGASGVDRDGNPRVPRLLPGTLGNFPGCL